MADTPDPVVSGPVTVVGTPTRLLRATGLVVSVFLLGTAGYRVVEGAPWWEAFYMTVITITTVGYGDVFPLSRQGQLLTVVLLISGLGIFFFLASEIGRSIMAGELRLYLGRVRRTRMIERMSGHEIVCGYGRMGRAVVAELRAAGREVVVIDSRAALMRELAEHGQTVVTGDATLEPTLRAANVEQAVGLVSCLTDDAHNVYAVLTARTLNSDLFIAARATGDGAEQRLLQAGATRVVNPYRLGGTRLAQLVVKPAIVSFFDASVRGNSLQLDQTSLHRSSPLVGQTLTEATIRERWGVSVVAIQRGPEVVANPAAGFRLEAEDVIVVFGSRPQLAGFFHECE